MLRYRINWAKAIEAIDFLAQHQDGITQYYVGKVCYFADKEHLLDYGHPITGDRYVAMEHGPVPSAIYDLLKEDSGLPDELLTESARRFRIRPNKNLRHVSSRNKTIRMLSGSEKEYLLASLKKYGRMEFTQLKKLSHDDAWETAWAEPGIANEMNPLDWLLELPEKERSKAREYLADRKIRVV